MCGLGIGLRLKSQSLHYCPVIFYLFPPSRLLWSRVIELFDLGIPQQLWHTLQVSFNRKTRAGLECAGCVRFFFFFYVIKKSFKCEIWFGSFVPSSLITSFISSPESRSCSPIVSDTEIEQRRHEEESTSDPSVVSQSWKWGELPSPLPRSQQVSSTKMNVPMESTDEEAVKKQQQEEAQKSMLSGMFSFMKKTKHMRHDQTEGIYLSELNSEELDPEVAALYFPHSYRGETKTGNTEEDAESGNGPSIPHSPNSQSPHTVDGGNYLSNCPLR